MEISEAKVSAKFVISVLRQHEIKLNTIIAELEPLVNKIDELTDKMQHIVDVSDKSKLQECT